MLFVFTLGHGQCGNNETLIFEELFSTEGDASTSGVSDEGNGHNWNATITSGPNDPAVYSFFGVDAGFGNFENTNYTGEWETDPIDIDCFQSVSFEIECRKFGNDAMDPDDYIEISYSTDGGGSFTQSFRGSAGFSSQLVSESGLTGSSLVLRVAFSTDSGSELLTIDNIRVCGVRTTPTFNDPIGPYCTGQMAPPLPSNSDDVPPVSGTWSPATVNTSTIGTTTYEFTPDNTDCYNTVEIDITVSSGPTANDAGPLSSCLRIDGTGQFNLTTADNDVNGGSGLPVTYYEDAAGTIPIADPTAFVYNFGMPPGFPIILPSLNGQVYARVDDNGCLSDIVMVDLVATLGPATSLDPNPLFICLDPVTRRGDVNLDPFNSQIVTSGGEVQWFGWEGLPNLPFFIGNGGTYTLDPPATLYGVYIDGNDCIYFPSTLNVNAHPIPDANTPSDMSSCADENGEAIFDLTTRDIEVGTGDILWYEDMDLTSLIPDPTMFTVTNSGDQIEIITIYAVNQDPSTLCVSETVSMDLVIYPYPSWNPIDPIQVCSTPGSNSLLVDLTENDEAIVGMDGRVEWFLDDLATNPVPLPTMVNVTVPGNTYYAQVYGPEPGNCLGPVVPIEYILNQSPTANEPEEKEICIDPDQNMVMIDLTAYNDEIYIGGGQIKWFSDAMLTNEIGNPEEYQAIRTLTEVYARVEENGCFSNVVVLRFVELERPEARDASIDACDDGSGFATFDLTSINDQVNGGTGLPVFYYEEFDGEFLSALISDPADYNTDRMVVYAIVDNGDCISNVATITLNILNNAELIDISPISVCADENGQARINLLSYEADMLDGQPGTITWFLDDQVTLVPFPDSVIITGDTTFIAQAGVGTSCASDQVSILFQLSNGINYTEPNNPYLLCSDPTTGLTLIDLDAYVDSIYNGAGTAIWTETNGDTIDLSMDYFANLPTTLNVVLTEGLCVSDLITFEFEERPSFNPNDASLTRCDDGSGNATFNLRDAENDIFNGGGARFTYFMDQGGMNVISNPGNYGSRGETVYVFVEIDGCFGGPAELMLNVESSAQACNSSLDTCAANGMITLNLLNFNDEVNCGNGTAVPVTWYNDPSALSEISAPSNYLSNGNSVWFIVGTGICASDTLEFPITINPLPSASQDTLESCDNGNGLGTFDLTKSNNTVNGNSGNSVSWYEDSGLINPIVNQSNHEATDQTIVYAVVTDGGCRSLPSEILLTIIDEPSFSVPIIDTCGDEQGTIILDLTLYEDDINSSGQVNWYIDMNGTIPIADPSSFFTVSATIYAQVDINGCLSELTPVPLNIKACSCLTQAAELIPGMIDVCLPDNLMVDTLSGTMILEQGDQWQYVLHDGSINGLGNILDRNTSGSFIYNPTYVLSDTYYVHVIAGPLDASGNIDINDDCFDISDMGIPVRFFEPASVDAEPLYFEICEGDTIIINLDFNQEGQNYSFQLFNTTTGNSFLYFTDVIDADGYDLILPNPEPGNYEVRNIEYTSVDCFDPDFTKEITIDVITETEASQSMITCDSTNNFYIVEILLKGGNDASDYTLSSFSTHGGAFINDSIFVSDPIPVDEESIFAFSGRCGGSSSVTIPPQDCSELCTTDAGSFLLDTAMVCTADFITITESNNVLDNDDVVYFVIHDDPDLFSSGFRIVQTTREIFYDPSLTVGQTYYVTMVVGNGDPDGVFDTNDPCLDLSNTETIMFLPDNQLSISVVDNSICLGDSVRINFNSSVSQSIDLQIQGPNGIIDLLGVGDNDQFSFYSERSGIWEITNVNTPVTCLDIGQGQEVNVSNLSASLEVISDFDGFEISCGGLNDGAIRVLPMNGVEPYLYQWSDGGTGFERNELFAGNYRVTITDAGGCTDSLETTLTEPIPIQLIATASDPECFGAETGSIFVESVQGGSGLGYKVAINGFIIDSLDVDSLPYELNDLGSGFYEIGVFDSNNCYNAVSVELASPQARTININRNALPGDSIVNIGETVQLQVQSPFSFDSIQWDTEFEFECVNPPLCDIIRIMPLNNGFVNVSAIDEDGCPADASIYVLVNTERNVFAPGNFSPNGDGNNDYFTLFSNQIRTIQSMEIYDRWGNQLWRGENFEPNLESLGWDGTYKGEVLNPAVFIWVAEIELLDNTTRIYKGDISLIR